MKKISAIELSIVFSVKIESDDRLNNLLLNIQFYETYFEDYELIIIEQGVSGRLAHLLNSPAIKYLFIPSEGCHYKTRNLNLGSSLATREIIMMMDVDVICVPESISKAIQHIKEGASFVAPYNGIATNISRDLLNQGIDKIIEILIYFPKDFDKDLKKYDYAIMKPLYGNNSYHNAGGCLIYTKQAFFAIGGWNTNFISYGYEDVEFLYRVKKLGYEVVRFDEFNIYHFDHSRNVDSYYNNFYRMNESEWDSVRAMATEKLLEYALNGFKKLVFDHAKETMIFNTRDKFSIESIASPRANLDGVSIIVPVYMPDPEERIYLDLLIHYFESYFNNYEIILVEGDTRNCKYMRFKKNVKYFWLGTDVYDHGSTVAYGKKVASNKIKAVWDYRTLINPVILIKRLRLVSSGLSKYKIRDSNWYVKGWEKRPGTGVLLSADD